jgi:hypothetical protein
MGPASRDGPGRYWTGRDNTEDVGIHAGELQRAGCPRHLLPLFQRGAGERGRSCLSAEDNHVRGSRSSARDLAQRACLLEWRPQGEEQGSFLHGVTR